MAPGHLVRQTRKKKKEIAQGWLLPLLGVVLVALSFHAPGPGAQLLAAHARATAQIRPSPTPTPVPSSTAPISPSIGFDPPAPPTLEFSAVGGLSLEATEKLTQRRPETLGQASRIPGVTPADVSVLMLHVGGPR